MEIKNIQKNNSEFLAIVNNKDKLSLLYVCLIFLIVDRFIHTKGFNNDCLDTKAVKNR
jgi:hypothetical protein